jgi:hypothetical protein
MEAGESREIASELRGAGCDVMDASRDLSFQIDLFLDRILRRRSRHDRRTWCTPNSYDEERMQLEVDIYVTRRLGYHNHQRDSPQGPDIGIGSSIVHRRDNWIP